MGGSFSFFNLLESGGFLLGVLIVAFIITTILVIERWIYFRSFQSGEKILQILLSDQTESPTKKDPIQTVMEECYLFLKSGKNFALFDEVKNRAIAQQIPVLERFLVHLAGFSSVSPFVGLLGTVFGIIRAFQSLGGGEGSQAMGGLNAGIAEALVTTAAGLLVAIPATLAYNIFRKKMERTLLEMEIYCSRMKVELYSGDQVHK